MSISKIKPRNNENPDEFLKRLYREVKKSFPEEKFWLARKMGKRNSFICGEMEEPGFKPDKKEIGNAIFIFFSMDNNKQNNDFIYKYFFDIYNKYHK